MYAYNLCMPTRSLPGPARPAEIDAVLAASRGLVAVAARSLAALGEEVTLGQYRALVVLTTRGPQGLSALAEQLSVAPSTATRLCDRLVRKGLLRRSPHAADRRQVILETTESAAELVAAVMAARRAEIGRMLSQMAPAERRAIADALAHLARATGEDPATTEEVTWPL